MITMCMMLLRTAVKTGEESHRTPTTAARTTSLSARSACPAHFSTFGSTQIEVVIAMT